MSLNLSDIAILNIYKDELKEIDIKNSACYNFDNTMKVRDIDFSNILLDKKSNKTRKNILIYDISYKYFIDEKPLRIRFDKIDGFIKIYDGIRYLVLFGYERYDAMFNRNRYLISEKSGITESINHNFARIRIDSGYSFPTQKKLIFHNVIILIKPVVKRIKMNISIIYF